MSQGSANSTDSVDAFVNSVSPVNVQGQVVCYHRLPAKRLTSRTPSNPERDFFVCAKSDDDPERCKFWNNLTLCSVLDSKRPPRVTPTSMPATPQRPSQATRALFSRSPMLAAASLRKRQRTPPTPSSSAMTTSVRALKQRRVDGAMSNGARLFNAASSTLSSGRPDHIGAPATQAERRAARLRSIEDALLSVQAAPLDPSPATSRGLHRHVEESTQFSPHQSVSDAPHHSTSSLSQNKQDPYMFSRHAQDAQSDTGTNIDVEIDLAEMSELESEAGRVSPVDNDNSGIEESFSPSPIASSQTHPRQIPGIPQASAAEHVIWSPALPSPQTPGRGHLSRTFASGGKEGQSNPSMLLTPPGSSQPRDVSAAGAGPSTSQRGRTLLQDMLQSPTASMGKGSDPLNSASAVQRWQKLQDDPENPFRASAVARGSASPAPRAISVPDSVGGGVQADALSADSIASHLTALHGITEYVAKLERREKAMQKSAEVKGRRITQLEEEVQRLRNEKRALEETVAALQVRR
ncbi:hypothetical protein BC628DRAFT_505811 [Trametes gibbosa]|nr:hypothetical protein BC628DRAFT_505811 [Trametes gibbosa]